MNSKSPHDSIFEIDPGIPISRIAKMEEINLYIPEKKS